MSNYPSLLAEVPLASSIHSGFPNLKSRYEVCIVGGGVAGAALAAFLGKNGVDVLLVEKDLNEQDRIVGELLQPGGVHQLQQMNIHEALDGIDAQPVHGYSVIMNGRQINIPYPEIDGKKAVGYGFRNGKFVQNLRALAKKQSSVTVLEANCKELLHSDDEIIQGISVELKGGNHLIEIKAGLTVVCDGFFSVFKKQLSKSETMHTGFFIGLVLKDCPLPVTAHGHVFITPAFPFLCYPIANNEVRMLIEYSGTQAPRKSEELFSYLRQQILSVLPSSMHTCFENALHEGRMKVMPNHRMPARPLPLRGAVLLGDALNMRHPLTGGGMTVAFTDVHELGKQIFQGVQAGAFHPQRYYNSRKQNTTINILADALYGVFRDAELGQACFDYLAKGGKKASDPVKILSGISRSRSLLIRHFFAVAFYGAVRKLFSNFSSQGMAQAYGMVARAFHIVYPLQMQDRLPGWYKWLLRTCASLFKHS